METKFNVGDKVRTIYEDSHSADYGITVNMTGTVIGHHWKFPWVLVKLDKWHYGQGQNNNEWYFPNKQLEKVR